MRLNTSISLVHSPFSFYLVAWHCDNRKTDFCLYIDDTVCCCYARNGLRNEEGSEPVGLCVSQLHLSQFPLGKLKPSRSEGEMNLNEQTCHNMVQPFLAGSFSPHGQPEISIVFLFTCRNFRLIPMAEGMLCGIFMDSKSFNKTDYLIQIEKENSNSIAIISP